MVAGFRIELFDYGASCESGTFAAKRNPFILAADPDLAIPAPRIIFGKPAAPIVTFGANQFALIPLQKAFVGITVATIGAAEADETYGFILLKHETPPHVVRIEQPHLLRPPPINKA